MSWRVELNPYQKEILSFEHLYLLKSAFDAPHVFLVSLSYEVNMVEVGRKMKDRFPLLSVKVLQENNNSYFINSDCGPAVEDYYLAYDLLEDKEAYEILCKYPLSINEGMLFKLGQIKTKNKKYLYFNVHHVLADGVGQEIISQSFSELCRFVESELIEDYSFIHANQEINDQVSKAQTRFNPKRIKEEWESFSSNLFISNPLSEQKSYCYSFNGNPSLSFPKSFM